MSGTSEDTGGAGSTGTPSPSAERPLSDVGWPDALGEDETSATRVVHAAATIDTAMHTTRPAPRPGDADADADADASVPTRATEASTLYDLLPVEAPSLNGRYQDLGAIGVGAMGEVRRVRDRKLEAVVAMKMMRPELARNAGLRRRFRQETRITAQLGHPSVVAVQNQGELPDGRLWFTMTLVRGRSLRQIISELNGTQTSRWLAVTEGGWTLQRLLHAFARICATIGYAHSLGIIHRDIKPPNMMLGRFGEVMVMDWGVARKIGEPDFHTDRFEAVNVSAEGTGTLHGQLVGTPVYMAPEQFLGQTDQVGSAADVWGLGAMLYELLTGAPPYTSKAAARAQGPIRAVPSTDEVGMPVGVPELCMRMLSTRAADRPSAAAVAEELTRWLDGSARRAQAREMVEAAASMRRGVQRAFSRVRVADSRLRDARATLGRVETVDRLRPVWGLEAEVQVAREAAEDLEQQVEDAYRAASKLAPDEPAPRQALAELFAERLGRALLRGDAALVRSHGRALAELDPARHAVLMSEAAWLSVDSLPTRAEVWAFRCEERDRRSVLVPQGRLGHTPLDRVELQAGSWLLEFRVPGHRPTRLPILLRRGMHRELREPWSGQVVPVPLLLGGTTPPDAVFVPPGYFEAGGDPLATDGLPRAELWTGGFLAARHLVSRRDVERWLVALVESGRQEEALALCPRLHTDQPVWDISDRGVRIRAGLRRSDGTAPAHELPASGFSLAGAVAYASWKGRQDGIPWTLPHDLLWERAARGADGRHYAWGNHFEPGFSNNGVSSGGNGLLPVSVPLFDVGPHGLVGACGMERELCLSGYRRDLPRATARIGLAPLPEEDLRWAMVRGGSYKSMPHFTRLAGRFAGARSDIFPWAGLRLFAPVPDRAVTSRVGLIDLVEGPGKAGT